MLQGLSWKAVFVVMIFFDLLGIVTIWPVLKKAYAKTYYLEFNPDKVSDLGSDTDKNKT